MTVKSDAVALKYRALITVPPPEQLAQFRIGWSGIFHRNLKGYFFYAVYFDKLDTENMTPAVIL